MTLSFFLRIKDLKLRIQYKNVALPSIFSLFSCFVPNFSSRELLATSGYVWALDRFFGVMFANSRIMTILTTENHGAASNYIN